MESAEAEPMETDAEAETPPPQQSVLVEVTPAEGPSSSLSSGLLGQVEVRIGEGGGPGQDGGVSHTLGLVVEGLMEISNVVPVVVPVEVVAVEGRRTEVQVVEEDVNVAKDGEQEGGGVIRVKDVKEVVEGEEDEETQRVEEIAAQAQDQQEPPPPVLSCNICEQIFQRQSHLTRHIEACHGERGSQHCTQCSATFNRKDSLSRHMATQHGENPKRFECTVVGCSRQFNRKDHLNKHLKGVHKLDPLPVSPTKGGGGGAENDGEDGGDVDLEGEEGDATLGVIMDVSSLSLHTKSKGNKGGVDKDKKYKCSNEGCGNEYPAMIQLHRHRSRGHNSELETPNWSHSVFGDSELKLDAGEEGGVDATLCMFCCKSYHQHVDIEKQRRATLASDPHFIRFCEAALRQQKKRMSTNSIIKSLNSLSKLSVCPRCFNKIGYAMGTKVAADDVEQRVQELRRQLDAELKNLQSEVDQFYVEMKIIEDMIRDSDMTCLESYLAAMESQEEKEQSSVVLLLRDGIFAVMNDVEVYCNRMKGQQIVVNNTNIQQGKKKGGGAMASGSGSKTGKRGRKRKRGKGINPLLHVKVEHGPGSESGAASASGPPSDSEDKEDDPEKGIDESMTFGGLPVVETPRRQPARKARVRTEEFMKSFFEKQKAGELEEDLEAVIKTEVPSDAEADAADDEGDALTIAEDVVTETGGEEGGDKTDGDKDKDKSPVVSSSSDATTVIAKKSKPKLEVEEKVADSAKKEGGEGEELKKTTEGTTPATETGKDAEVDVAAGMAPPPPIIEEILIEDDDLLDELFYDEETSDEDFNFDTSRDDLESRSESSSSESEDFSEDDDEDDDEDPEEPAPKRARGRPPGQRSRKSDIDPFKIRKTRSKKAKTSKIKSNNKIAQQHNIDMSGMSEFRKRLLLRILKKNSKSSSPLPDPLSGGERDPRVNFRFEYSKDQGTLVLGDVQVIIHDEHSSLQCSKCGYLSSPAEKPRRSVPRIMYNHILGKHLFAFQCPQCPATLGSYRRYLDHIKGHQMGFMCDVCGKPLFSEEALRRHRWGHMNAEEMAEAISKGIKDPRRKHDPNLTFQCTTCGKVFSKKMLLRQHEKTHAENRERIVCTLCGKTFLPSGYISHQKYSCFPEGYEPPRVQCQLCPSTFKSVVLRARHMKYAHSTASIEKPFKCHICGKGFAANEHLQKHIKRHSDARPYLCRKGCGANYKTRKDCTRHEKKCEGSGTPMMRHKGRNDQLNAAPKQEPGVETPQQVQQTPTIIHTTGAGGVQVQHVQPQQQQQPTVIQQPQQAPVIHQQQPPQQFNVYNIL